MHPADRRRPLAAVPRAAGAAARPGAAARRPRQALGVGGRAAHRGAQPRLPGDAPVPAAGDGATWDGIVGHVPRRQRSRSTRDDRSAVRRPAESRDRSSSVDARARRPACRRAPRPPRGPPSWPGCCRPWRSTWPPPPPTTLTASWRPWPRPRPAASRNAGTLVGAPAARSARAGPVRPGSPAPRHRRDDRRHHRRRGPRRARDVAAAGRRVLRPGARPGPPVRDPHAGPECARAGRRRPPTRRWPRRGRQSEGCCSPTRTRRSSPTSTTSNWDASTERAVDLERTTPTRPTYGRLARHGGRREPAALDAELIVDLMTLQQDRRCGATWPASRSSA